MSSAPSVPGVEVGAPWLGGCEHVPAAGALELLATPHRTFGPRRAELPESRAVRDAELAGGALPEFLAGTKANPGCWMQVATTLARMGERIPVARIVQVIDASIQAVPVGGHLADTLDGPGTPFWHSTERRFDPLAPFRKEYIHAPRLPAGL